MLVTASTIKIFQQEQETNAEAEIPVESERQGSVLSITTFSIYSSLTRTDNNSN